MAEDQRKRIDAESSGQNSSLKTNTVTKAKRQPYSVQKATCKNSGKYSVSSLLLCTQNRLICSAGRSRRFSRSSFMQDGRSRKNGDSSSPAVRSSSSRARVIPTYRSRRSSSTSAGRPCVSSGKIPALTPATNTAGNSSPFAPCSVISLTAPDSHLFPAARETSASSPKTSVFQSSAKLLWKTAV